jgi:hypothetical protein
VYRPVEVEHQTVGMIFGDAGDCLLYELQLEVVRDRALVVS